MTDDALVPTAPADPAAASPIADLTYRTYDGPLHTRAMRWWIVALSGLRATIKQKGFWIVGALHWAMDTRDPASSTHGYVQNVMHRGPWGFMGRGDNPITWDHMRAIGERVYGRADTLDPWSGYEGKAIPAAWHGVRSVLTDCLSTDDQVFP